MIIAPPIPQFPAVVAGRGDRARPVRLPALDLRFDLGEVDAGITTTRADGTATRFNEFGVLESVVADTLRIDYDPASLRTSSTSLSVGLGVRTLVLSSAGPVLGDPIRITRTGDAATFMAGRVVYVSGTTVKVNVERKGGSGTFADWQVIKCRGALVEPAATNVLTYPEQFDNAAGWQYAAVSPSPDAAVSPDGTMTMDKIVEDTATSAHSVGRAVTARPTIAAGAHVESFFFEAAGRKKFTLFNNGSSGLATAVFDVVAGTVVATGGAQYLASGIEDVGGDIYRCWRAFTALAGTTAPTIYLARDTLATATIDNYAGDGSSGLNAWGAMSEVGSRPSSYVASGAAAATRNKDAVSMTGAAFSDWYTTPAFTMRAEITGQASGTRVYWEISDGTANHYISLRSVSGALALVVVTGGVEQANLSLGTVTTGTRYKIAASWAANDIAASLDGAAVVTDASATLPTVDRLHVGADGAAANQAGAPVLHLTGYQVRATNTRLQELSS